MQTGRKRDPRMPDVPTIHELMNEYKTPPVTRSLVTLILAGGDLGAHSSLRQGFRRPA